MSSIGLCGAPPVFLDAAFAVIRNGLSLHVTCTDMACLAGAHVGRCFTMYADLPWHSRCGHEFGLRLELSTLATHAARHNKYVTPLVCFHADFSVRLCACPLVDKLATLSALDEALVFTARLRGRFFINQLVTNKNGVMPAHPTLSATTCVHWASALATNGPSGRATTATTPSPCAVAQYEANPDLHPNSRRRIIALLTALSEELPDVPLFFLVDTTAHFLWIRSRHSPSSRRGAARPRPGASACGRVRAAGGRSPG